MRVVEVKLDFNDFHFYLYALIFEYFCELISSYGIPKSKNEIYVNGAVRIDPNVEVYSLPAV